MSRSCRSSVRVPCSALANTTGKQAMNTVNTGVPSLMPNHSMASTSQAMGGVPSSTVTSGRDSTEAVTDKPASSPSTLPTPSASASPMKARRAVAHSAGPAAPCCTCAHNAAKAVSGSGRMSGSYSAATASQVASSSNRLAPAPQPLHR